MCTPMSLAVAAVAMTAASSVSSVIAQQQQAQETADAQNKYNRQIEQNQLIARNQNLAGLEMERKTAFQDATEQINQNTLAARKAEATARVSAGEAGLSGLSVDSLLRDLAGQAGYDNATATENYLRQNTNINFRRENAQNEAVSAVNSVRQPTIQRPDYLGAALRIGQSGANAYAYYKARTDPAWAPRQPRLTLQTYP